MNGDAPLSSGEVLGENPAWLDRAGVRALFETAMRSEAGADIAYYPVDSVAGRLRPGVIRSGDIYSLESWQEAVALLEVHGSNLAPTMREQLSTSDREVDHGRMYTIATTEYAADALRERIGRIDVRRPGPLLRDVAVAHLARHGFAAPG
jgi:hypothetical protein